MARVMAATDTRRRRFALRRLRRLAGRREAHALVWLLALFVAFSVLLVAVRGEWLPGVDLAATLALQRHRSATLDAVAVCFTYLGGGAVLFPVGCAAAAWLWNGGRRRTALLVLLSLSGHLLNFGIKLIAHRPRPDAGHVAVLMPADGTSFPSGHAQATVTAYGFLAVLCWVLLPPGRVRRLAVLLPWLLTALIGLSRVYVGGHWLSDVLGGWVCGLFFLAMLVEAHRLYAGAEIARVANDGGLPKGTQ